MPPSDVRPAVRRALERWHETPDCERLIPQALLEAFGDVHDVMGAGVDAAAVHEHWVRHGLDVEEAVAYAGRLVETHPRSAPRARPRREVLRHDPLREGRPRPMNDRKPIGMTKVGAKDGYDVYESEPLASTVTLDLGPPGDIGEWWGAAGAMRPITPADVAADFRQLPGEEHLVIDGRPLVVKRHEEGFTATVRRQASVLIAAAPTREAAIEGALQLAAGAEHGSVSAVKGSDGA